MHEDFVKNATEKVNLIHNVLGLAVGGSWIDNQIDEFSDVDLIAITEKRISDSFDKMYEFASKLGNLLNAFTGEHVGEKRLLICMYDSPLIHVDIKFVTLEEFKYRVEDPVILWDKNGSIKEIIDSTKSSWPELDYQWIEDRFWTWIHYAALKLGRGEYFEALDFLSFLRITVLSPLMQIKNGQLPRGLRKVEYTFNAQDLNYLEHTVPVYTKESITNAIENAITLYRGLRTVLFNNHIKLYTETKKKCVAYFNNLKLK
jgi:hypothetical protein